jgi:nitrite reductase (NADH) large subunit
VGGIIPAALDHAPIVAANLLGRGPAFYRQTIPQNTLKVAGVSLTSIGNATAEEGNGTWILERESGAAGDGASGSRYERFVVREGLLEGCILLGSRQNLGFVTSRMARRVTKEELEALPI